MILQPPPTIKDWGEQTIRSDETVRIKLYYLSTDHWKSVYRPPQILIWKRTELYTTANWGSFSFRKWQHFAKKNSVEYEKESLSKKKETS